MKRWVQEGMPIWRAAMAHGRFPLSWPVAALTALVPLLFVFANMVNKKGPLLAWWKMVLLVPGVPLLVYVTLLSSHLMVGFLTVRTPANMLLVPGFGLRLRRSAGLALLACYLPWLLLAALFPRQSGFILLPACFMFAFALLQLWIGRRAWLAYWVPFALMFVGNKPIVWWVESSAPVLAISCLLLVLLGWCSFNALLPRQGMGKGKFIAPSSVAEVFGWKAPPLVSRSYLRQLARVPSTSLQLVFGPGRHLEAYWPGLALALLCAAVLEWLLPPDLPLATGFRLFVMATMPVLFVAQSISLVAAARRTAGEQSLFRLTPGAPRAADLNAALAKQTLRSGGVRWLMTCAALLAALGIFGASVVMRLCVVSVMLAMLWIVAWPVRDYARDARAGAWRVLAFGLPQLVLLVLSVMTLRFPPAWLGVQLLLLALSLGVIHSRWRAMTRAPVAFPTGRLRMEAAS